MKIEQVRFFSKRLFLFVIVMFTCLIFGFAQESATVDENVNETAVSQISEDASNNVEDVVKNETTTEKASSNEEKVQNTSVEESIMLVQEADSALEQNETSNVDTTGTVTVEKTETPTDGTTETISDETKDVLTEENSAISTDEITGGETNAEDGVPTEENPDGTTETTPVEEIKEPEPEPYEGWKISVPASADAPNVVEIATFDGKTASINVPGGLLTDMQVLYIGRSIDAIWTIPGLYIKQIYVYVESGGKFRFVFIPESFVYNEKELREFLPSGMTFSYDNSLYFDVVLKVDGLRPRVQGIYVSPEDFADSIYRATVVPDLYMYDNELSERVSRLEKALLALSSKGFYARPSVIDEGLIQFVKNMYNENKNITKQEVITELKNQKIKYSTHEVDTIFAVLLGIYE